MPRSRRLFSISVILCCCSCALSQPAGYNGFAPPRVDREGQALPKLTYTKLLKGSVPEYMSITVDSNGSGKYEGRKVDDPPSSRPLKLSPPTTKRLFDLAAQLDNFRLPGIESHKKVANLGAKTFTYEAAQKKNQVEFNYTLNRDAQELSELFERIGAVETHLEELQYAIKYDHLGLPQELLQIQMDLNNKALAEAELLVPTLDQIARNPRFLHLAQTRAQDILQRLQNNR